MIDAEILKQVGAMTAGAERILVASHVRPDGDAVGSAGALAMMLEAVRPGKARPEVLLLGACPATYRFALAREPWVLGREVSEDDVAAGKLDDYDLIVVVDTCAVRQLPGIGEYLLQREAGVLVIDHHLARDGIGQCHAVDTSACAAGLIVTELAEGLDWPISTEAATALYMALATDTGWFRFENADGRCYETAGRLVAAGARPDEVYQAVFQSYPAARVRLVAAALGTLTLLGEERLAVMEVTRAMLAETGAERSHIENIVNEAQQIGSVENCLLLVEQDDGSTRCSLRSRGEGVDVNVVAQQFGGGGHARAAGASVDEPLAAARENVTGAFLAAMDARV